MFECYQESRKDTSHAIDLDVVPNEMFLVPELNPTIVNVQEVAVT